MYFLVYLGPSEYLVISMECSCISNEMRVLKGIYATAGHVTNRNTSYSKTVQNVPLATETSM